MITAIIGSTIGAVIGFLLAMAVHKTIKYGKENGLIEKKYDEE